MRDETNYAKYLCTSCHQEIPWNQMIQTHWGWQCHTCYNEKLKMKLLDIKIAHFMYWVEHQKWQTSCAKDKTTWEIEWWNKNNRPLDVMRCPRCFAGNHHTSQNLYIELINRFEKPHYYQLWCVHCGYKENFPNSGAFNTIERQQNPKRNGFTEDECYRYHDHYCERCDETLWSLQRRVDYQGYKIHYECLTIKEKEELESQNQHS